MAIEYCKICKNRIIKKDEDTWFEFNANGDKSFLHWDCYQAALDVIGSQEDKEQEIFELNKKINDLEMEIVEVKKKANNSVDVSSLVERLNEIMEEQRVNSHRAPKGSDYSRIAAFRANDAEDMLNRINDLLKQNNQRVEQ